MSAQSFVTTWSELSVADRRAMWRAAWIKRCQDAELETKNQMQVEEVHHEPLEYDPPEIEPEQPTPAEIPDDDLEDEPEYEGLPKFQRYKLIDDFPLFPTSTIPIHGKRRPVYTDSDGDRSTEFWYYLGSAMATSNKPLPSAYLNQKPKHHAQ